MNDILENLARSIGENLWLAPVIALVAGVLTSFTPCSLSTIPLIIGCVDNLGERTSARSFRLSLVFALGSTLTFTALGLAASLLGSFLTELGPWLHLILAAILILMALQTFGVIELIPEASISSAGRYKGNWGAFLAGLFAGAFSSHCTTPVLVALLALVTNKASVAYGILLLIIFSAGHAVLSVVAGTSVGFAHRVTSDPKYAKLNKAIKLILGTIILLVAAYLFYEFFADILGHGHEH